MLKEFHTKLFDKFFNFCKIISFEKTPQMLEILNSATDSC